MDGKSDVLRSFHEAKLRDLAENRSRGSVLSREAAEAVEWAIEKIQSLEEQAAEARRAARRIIESLEEAIEEAAEIIGDDDDEEEAV